MHERFYRFADVCIKVSGPPFEENEQLKPFSVMPAAADFSYEINVGAINNETMSSDLHCFWSSDINCVGFCESVDGNTHRVLLNEKLLPYYGSNVVQRILNLPELMLSQNALFLHASYVIHNGGAILFTADKQVGKSTQAELWRIYRNAEIVNGDRALIKKQNGIWYAHGSPYCGTSGISKNVSAPITAIVILSQGRENTAVRARQHKAVSAMLSGCSFDVSDRDSVAKAIDIITGITENVRFYELDCLPDCGAIEALEHELYR